jgi:hypothetical protein
MSDNRYKIFYQSRFRQKETSNINGSFSLFRQYGLSSGRIQKQSTASTLTLPLFGGQTVWEWDATDIVVSDGSPVTSWVDRQHGVELAQTDVNFQPVYRADYGSSGYPAIETDGINDRLFNNTVPAPAAHFGTEYIIIRGAVFDAATKYFIGGSSAGRHAVFMTSGDMGLYADSTYDTDVDYADGDMITAVWNLASSQIYEDRVLVHPGGDPGSAIRKGLYVGSAFDGTLAMPGGYHSVVLYDAVHSTEQREQVWDYLEAKWGLV